MHKLWLVVKDLGISFAVGAIAGAAVALILFGAGTAVGGSLHSGLETAKDGAFVLLAFGLFLLAGMFLVKGKKREKSLEESGWRHHFHVIGLKTVTGMMCLGFLAVAVVLDWVMLR